MKRMFSILTATMCAFGVMAAEEVRTIRLRQDDAQVRFESKIYQLKNINAEEILPFVNSAVKRYNVNSTVRRVTSGSNAQNAILVSTGKEFLPMVDDIVAALDQPGAKKGEVIDGTGLARVAYAPQYRAAGELSGIIDSTIGSSTGKAYVNRETNTIFWRDQTAAAKRTLDWVSKLDRPLPQVRVRLNYYELRDSDLKDWGFDYLAWKNGPGVNLLNVGYNAGHLYVNETLNAAANVLTSTWGLGGFFTAPQFDMSFIRCLQQSGNANSVASASLTMVNTPVKSEAAYARLQALQDSKPDTAPFIYRVSMQPEYQNIAKNTLGRTFVGKSFYEDADGTKHSDPPALEAQVVNPFICPANKELKTGGVIFDYSLYFKSVIERGNTGSELNNSALVTGAATLGFGGEKILAIYEKENDVEQTIGLPILCRIPVIKYLFSTVTTIKERTYIIVTAEANEMSPSGDVSGKADVSAATGIDRRIENPLRPSKDNEKK